MSNESSLNLKANKAMIATWVAFGVLACAAIAFGAAVNKYKLMLNKEAIQAPQNRQFIALPSETPNWLQVGQDRRESPEVEETLGTKNYVSRVYVPKGPEGKPVEGEKNVVEFHAAYYTGMIDTVPHVSDRCFIGAGMTLASSAKDVPVPIDMERWRKVETDVPKVLEDRLFRARMPNWSDRPGSEIFTTFDPSKLVLHSFKFIDPKGREVYSGYFFIANGGVVSRAEDVRLLAFDLRNKYAYYAKLQFTSTTVKSQEELGEVAGSILSDLLPDVMLCVPPWQDVERGTYPPAANRSQGAQ